MNQFFNFRRFCLLVAKHWADNKKRYSLSFIGFVILLMIWFGFTMVVDGNDPMGQEIQMLTYFFSLFGVGIFYASQYFRELGSKSKGINFLLVPASAFEKILCSILFTVVFFFTVFTAGFYLVNALMVAISNNFLISDDPLKQVGVINVFKAAVLPFEGKSTINVLLIFLGIQSIFLLGSVYFEKYSFVKTVISGFLVFIIFFCLVFLLYEYLMPSGGYESGFLTSYRIPVDEKNDHLVQIPHWIGDIIRFMLMYAFAPFLWLVSFYRLKEKQV